MFTQLVRRFFVGARAIVVAWGQFMEELSVRNILRASIRDELEDIKRDGTCKRTEEYLEELGGEVLSFVRDGVFTFDDFGLPGGKRQFVRRLNNLPE